MSGTRSPSRAEPATDAALIVAHGQPSAPEGPEADLTRFADAVAAHLPGWRLRGATLAMPGALAAAVAALGPAPVVYPLFMADGWFTSTLLPRRLAEAGAPAARMAPPLGLDPALPALMARAARVAAWAHGWDPAETAVLLAAHGSPSKRRPRMAAEIAAHAMGRHGRFRAIRTGFVDERPTVAQTAAGLASPALCLPFFARLNGHVRHDLPQGLAEGGFTGPLLDPIGLDPAIPGLAAAGIAARARAAAA